MRDQSLFWDKVARKYAAKSVPDQSVYEQKLMLTQKLFRSDTLVLEIGCGTGSTSLIHAPHVAKITAIDFSAEMIQIAKDKAQSQKIKNIDFSQASVDKMNYPENEFDIIMAHSILHLLEDKNTTLRKIYKSLKPGGYFITSTGCIGGMFMIFKPLWFIGFKLGLLPFLNFFTKNNLINQIGDNGLEIQTNWSTSKVDIFLIAKKV